MGVTHTNSIWIDERVKAVEGLIGNAALPPTFIPSDIFSGAPEGDFVWDGDDGGDWIPFQCNCRSCAIRWHKAAYGVQIYRKDGVRGIEFYSIDEDGDWPIDQMWREGEPPFQAPGSRIEYFRGWARYYLDCIQTHEDPLNSFDSVNDASWTETYLAAAEDMAESIEQKA